MVPVCLQCPVCSPFELAHHQWSLALDDRDVADGEVGDVGDRVERARRALEGYRG